MKKLIILFILIATSITTAGILRQVQQGVLTFQAANTAASKLDTLEIVRRKL